MDEKKIVISIGSDLHQVQLIGLAIRSLCEDLHLATVDVGQVELAVVESVNNSIEHAYDFQKGHKVDVSFEVTQERLTVVVRDYGVPMTSETIKLFTDEEIKMPDIQTELDLLPEGGWGVQLVKSLCDSMSYERENSCNTLSLAFQLRDKAA